MQLNTETRYVLVDGGGNAIGQDKGSGGYPYTAYNVEGVKFFSEPVDAAHYARIVDTFGPYKLVKVRFVTELVTMPDVRKVRKVTVEYDDGSQDTQFVKGN